MTDTTARFSNPPYWWQRGTPHAHLLPALSGLVVLLRCVSIAV
ncbi:hypothetical protein NY751_11545 [Xanthomonas campestris]|nr:hypothetical protein [Xanthomonas campestris]MDC8746697.1 hypothetical protein [Xanthomonas campestris]